ncbi:hypothetical protein Poly30_44510 [Planctomycetes bacterium Poly30]|uniref:Cna protein B-type domain protein n=1 Tax=Saltatorellus ferox TaxID=2528018 RepID=A0A518EXS7_9BACT|nr:hypothetical protein Poly30_44510 [Planctomycetes bacterium Poly30]
MRIVTILILIALAAGAYIVRFAGSDSKKVAPEPAMSVAEAASEGGRRPEENARSAESGVPGSTAPSAAEDLPTAFPAELKRRSRDLGRDLGLEPSREPGGEPGGETGRAVSDGSSEPEVAEVADVEAELPKIEPSRRPVREIVMPSRSPADEPAVTESDLTAAEEADAAEPAVSSVVAVDLEKAVEPATLEAPAPDLEDPAGVLTAGTETSQGDASEGDAGPLLNTMSGLRGSVLDSSGRAVPRVKIDVLDTSTGEVLRALDAGVDGIFVAQDIAPGRYALAVRKSSVPLGISAPLGVEVCRTGDEPAGYGSVCVDVTNMGEPATAEIVLPLSSGIQGTVLGRSGQAAADVLVRAVSRVPGFEGQREIASTDGEGFFFIGLVPGPYELQVLLPGEGQPEDLTRTMEIVAKPGSALFLETVDFSKKAKDQRSSSVIPAAAPTEKVASVTDVIVLPALPTPRLGGEPPMLAEDATRSSVPVEPVFRRDEIHLGGHPKDDQPQPSDPEVVVPEEVVPEAGPEAGPEVGSARGTVELRGRIISKWGESLPAMGVLAETPDGKVVEMTQTDDSGNYVLTSVPVGSVIVRVARDLEINRAGPGGTTLLKRPEPLEILTFEGQKRVTLEDVVVDVRRVYRLSGKIKIAEEAFQEFKKTIRPVDRGRDFLTEEQFRRAYYRGLRLVQNNRGAAAGGTRPTTVRGQMIPIAPDGTFVWTCTLPADDIVLVLESRSGREGGGYRGPIGIPITPAGVRPATIEITYPALPDDAPKEADLPDASDLEDAEVREVDFSSPAAASVPAEDAPIAPIR